MRSKQYFTSIKNNPHEISTDPIFFYFSYKYFSEEKEEFSESSSRENNMPFTSLYKLNSIKSKGHILC